MEFKDISRFPEFVSLGIEHAATLDSYFGEKQPKVCELNFLELYGWRKIKKIRLSIYKGEIVFLLEKNSEKYIYPVLSENPGIIIKEVLGFFRKKGEKVGVMAFAKEDADRLGADKNSFVFEDDRDNYDYLYLAGELIKLGGRKYDSKRNHIKKFNKNYSYEFLPLDRRLLPECMEFQKRWCELRRCADDMSLANESEAAVEMLSGFDKMSAVGAVIRINNRVEGYTLASELNHETGEVVVEKANPEYLGIYQAINHMFCEMMFSKYKYINRQQDTGDEGLRKAKMSYNPVKMVEKYILYLK